MSIRSDILILGSGIAGLSCALKLAEHFEVSILTKKEAMETNTRYAQGGIASVMSGTDHFDLHVRDTLEAGAGLCHEAVVRKIVSDGPRLVEELVQLGVKFSMDPKQRYDLGREGGHSERRILHAGDMTGNELERVLLQKIKSHPRIKIYEFHVAIDLITSEKMTLANSTSLPNRCFGVYALDVRAATVHTFVAKATLLATGGAGKVYLYTSNPDIATGDGIAMAYRAGATIANLEFVQFHPTCLYNPGAFAPHTLHPARESGKTFLISEALRGEGAKLTLANGNSFMEKYHPLKELAPRDVVARAIDFEMKKRGEDYVLLDISHRGHAFIQQRFPNIYSVCLSFGFDLTQGPIPVVPAAHYFCGGVKTDLEGKTNLEGLYAIGEVACTGLHGANRLASNSLLEALALAEYTSASLVQNKEQLYPPPCRLPEWDAGTTTDSDEEVVITQNWEEIRRLLWNYVGIVRSDKRLKRAKNRIALLQEEIREYYWNVSINQSLIELRNIACVAELLIECAMQRKESRGLHYNRDYPHSDEAQKKDTLIRRKLET